MKKIIIDKSKMEYIEKGASISMKTLQFILFLLCLLVLTFTAFSQEIPKEITDIYTLQLWMRNNITYSQAKEIEYKNIGYWQTPEETIRWGEGDCEDMAFLYKHFLEKLGYKATVYGYYSKSWGHAITLFIYEGRYIICSNQYLYHTYHIEPVRAILNFGLNHPEKPISKIYRMKENCIYGKMYGYLRDYNTILIWRKNES